MGVVLVYSHIWESSLVSCIHQGLVRVYGHLLSPLWWIECQGMLLKWRTNLPSSCSSCGQITEMLLICLNKQSSLLVALLNASSSYSTMKKLAVTGDGASLWPLHPFIHRTFHLNRKLWMSEHEQKTLLLSSSNCWFKIFRAFLISTLLKSVMTLKLTWLFFELTWSVEYVVKVFRVFHMALEVTQARNQHIHKILYQHGCKWELQSCEHHLSIIACLNHIGCLCLSASCGSEDLVMRAAFFYSVACVRSLAGFLYAGLSRMFHIDYFNNVCSCLLSVL